jgi:hypothetical protein
LDGTDSTILLQRWDELPESVKLTYVAVITFIILHLALIAAQKEPDDSQYVVDLVHAAAGTAAVVTVCDKSLSENHFIDLEQRRISPRMDLPIVTVLKGDAPYERGYHNQEGGLL